MAIGDAIVMISSVAAGAMVDLQPGSGVEHVIHNIYYEDAIEIARYDGTNSLLFATLVGPDVLTNLQCHMTNTNRLRIKNTHATLAKLVAWDGMVTK